MCFTGPRVILFISPAGTSSDISDLRRASLRAQASGIKVVVLEVGRPEISQSPDLSSVASKPTELFYHQAPNINSLEEIQTQMLTCLCLAIGRPIAIDLRVYMAGARNETYLSFFFGGGGLDWNPLQNSESVNLMYSFLMVHVMGIGLYFLF